MPSPGPSSTSTPPISSPYSCIYSSRSSSHSEKNPYTGNNPQTHSSSQAPLPKPKLNPIPIPPCQHPSLSSSSDIDPMSRKKRNPNAPPQKYRCHWEGCDHSASTPSLLDRHMAIHNAPEHICPDPSCKTTFTQRWNLITHIRTVHHKIRSICNYCGKSFSSQSNLSHHINRIHKPRGEVPSGNKATTNERASKLRSWRNIDLKQLLDGEVPYPEIPEDGFNYIPAHRPSQDIPMTSQTISRPTGKTNRMSLGFLCEPVDSPVPTPRHLGRSISNAELKPPQPSSSQRYTPYESTHLRKRASTVPIRPLTSDGDSLSAFRQYPASERADEIYSDTLTTRSTMSSPPTTSESNTIESSPTSVLLDEVYAAPSPSLSHLLNNSDPFGTRFPQHSSVNFRSPALGIRMIPDLVQNHARFDIRRHIDHRPNSTTSPVRTNSLSDLYDSD